MRGKGWGECVCTFLRSFALKGCWALVLWLTRYAYRFQYAKGRKRGKVYTLNGIGYALRRVVQPLARVYMCKIMKRGSPWVSWNSGENTDEPNERMLRAYIHERLKPRSQEPHQPTTDLFSIYWSFAKCRGIPQQNLCCSTGEITKQRECSCNAVYMCVFFLSLANKPSFVSSGHFWERRVSQISSVDRGN